MGNSHSDSESERNYKPKVNYGNSAADNVINPTNYTNNNYDSDSGEENESSNNYTPNNYTSNNYTSNNYTSNNYTSNNNAFKYKNNYVHTYQNNKVNYIDKNLIKFDDINRNPLHVNLLHFDENLSSKENQNYYKYFKLNIVGGYFGINTFTMFTKYIDAINRSKIFIRYILIVSGPKSIDVLKYCYNYKYIDEILIFCNNINYYNPLKSLNKIKLVTNSFYNIVSYLKRKSYTNKELDMSNQIPSTPLITFYEYKNCYFAIEC